MKVWMLFLTLICYSATASEFTHIKLNPEFESHLTRPKTKSPLLQKSQSAKSINSLAIQESPFDQKMKVALLDAKPKAMPMMKGAKSIVAPLPIPIPADGEVSPLYDEIRAHLESSHQQLLNQQVQSINAFNRQFNLGSENFSGFSWQKPFGVVGVFADRQIVPNPLGNDWIVTDTFTFNIEATTFLEKLADAGLATMSSLEIGAFAGVTFHRSYTYWHYANSYQEGLTSDSTALFLPFLKFTKAGMDGMGPYEVMKREDMWTASAGGLITSPPMYGATVSAGVLASYVYQNSISVQNTNEEKKFQIGVKSKKTANAGATLSLQLDFFKLLQLTLLSADLNYEFSSSKEFTLGLSNQQWSQVKTDDAKEKELKLILAGFGSVKTLEPYIVRLDETSSSALEKRGSVLLWGKQQKQKTEQVRIIKDQTVKVFFKSYASNVKVVQDFMSRLFSAVFYKIFKVPVPSGNAAVYARNFNMEYEATHPQASDPKVIRIESTEQFSFNMTQTYNASRTDRKIDKGVKKDLIWFVDNFTFLPKNYKNDIDSEVLRGPIYVESVIRIDRAGFQHLIEADENDVFGLIANVCKSKRANDWTTEVERKDLLRKKLLLGADGCVKDIGKKYLSFKKDYSGNFLKPSLAKFRDFMTKYYKKAGNLAQLQQLFGTENAFVTGRISAMTALGMPFNTTFSSGQFRGLGVIDNFKRSTGSRAPATIVSE